LQYESTPLMEDADVTLTDYGLALECAVFAWVLFRRAWHAGAGRVPASAGARPTDSGYEPQRDRGTPRLSTSFVLFFIAIAVASVAGGTVHGFVPNERDPAHALIWSLTLVSIGVAAFAAWAIGARLLLRAPWARRLTVAAAVLLGTYCAAVLFVSRSYALAILHYLPAAVFLLFVLARLYLRTRVIPLLWGAVGLLLTFAAAVVQRLGLTIDPVYFDHNALYHAVQAVALFFLFVSAAWLTRAGVGDGMAAGSRGRGLSR
jgi:hypothetical protein